MADNDKYVAGEPGSELGAAEWLNSQDGLAIACDNMAIEVLPGTDYPKTLMPVHQHALVEVGAYLIENFGFRRLVDVLLHLAAGKVSRCHAPVCHRLFGGAARLTFVKTALPRFQRMTG